MKKYIKPIISFLLICLGCIIALGVYNKINEKKSEELYTIFIENVEAHNTTFKYQGATGIKIEREKVIEKMGVEKRYMAYNIDTFSYTYNDKGDYTFKIHYMMSKEEMMLAKERADYIASLATGTTYEKVREVHDYLIANCDYDTVRPGPYNCLYTGFCNCTGFSLSFQYIMDSLGIPCKYITDSDHAWNVVNIDGVWFNIDVTYDDTCGYDFFLKSDDDWKEHTRGDSTAYFSFTGDASDLKITDVKAYNAKMMLRKQGVYLVLIIAVLVAIIVSYIKTRNSTPDTPKYVPPVRKAKPLADKF